jgi:hypothetical protein
MAIPMDKSNESYIKRVISEEDRKLTYFTERDRNRPEDDRLFINLSIKEVLHGMSIAFINIINDIVSGQQASMSDYIMAFFKGDRMIYVGLLLILVAFSIYIIDITS